MGTTRPLTAWHARAAVAAAAAALLLPAPAAAAWDAAAVRAHCTQADAAAGATLLRSNAEKLRRTEPESALARACAALERDPGGFDPALELAQALEAGAQPQAAAALLRTLDSHPRIDATGSARVQLALAELENDARRALQTSEHADRALALLDRRDGAVATLVIRGLMLKASATRSLGKGDALTTTAALLAEAERLITANGLAVSYLMNDWLNQQTMLAYARSDINATIAWARREVDLSVKLDGPDTPEQIDALATLGATLSMLRRSSEAVAALTEGRRIGKASPRASRSAYLGILNNLSQELVVLGRSKDALDVAQEAVDTATAIWSRGSSQTLTPLNRRAIALETLQRYAEARADYAEILAIVERENQQLPIDRRLRLLDFIAGFQMRMNDLDAAQDMVRRGNALLADASGIDMWRGRFARRQAMIAAVRGQWANADRLHEQGNRWLVSTYGAGSVYILNGEVMRCEAQVHGGQPPRSCETVEANIDRMRTGSSGERVMARRALASHALARGQREQALQHQLQAVAAAQSENAQALFWDALNGLAGQLRAPGNRDLAVVLAKSAVVQIEAVRKLLRVDPNLQTGYLQDKYAVYRRLADWLAEDGRIDEALQVQRMLKGEEYRDFVRGRVDAAPDAEPAQVPWTPQEQAWLRTSPLAAPAPFPAAVPGDEMRRAEEDESARVRAWQHALQQWPSVHPRPTPTREPGAAFRASLAADELQATLFMGARHLNIVIESRRSRHVVRVAADPRALSRDIGRLLATLESRGDADALLRSLYQRVAAPIDNASQRHGLRRWNLRLDGDLRYLPFGALHDGRAHLIERYAITEQAQAALAGERQPARAAVAPWVQAFGNTRAGDGLPALQAITDEICGIVDGPLEGATARGCSAVDRRRAVPGRGWLDAAFTREHLKTAAASGRADRIDLLHIGTHFVLRPGEVGRSWMQLGDGTRLYLHDMLDWQLRSQDLVTLSACQTAAGGGAEVEGLATLMLNRGAGAVIASLWQVEDRSTSALMRALYGALRTGAAPADALRQAQLELLRSPDRQRQHPFHWAAFFLSSRGR